LCDRFDRGAIRCKWWFRVLSLAAAISTWMTLLLVILSGLAFPASRVFHDLVLHAVTPVLSAIVLVTTTVLLFFDLQGRWKDARWAAEHLRSSAVLYRAGLSPYDAADREQKFRRLLDWLATRVETRQGEPYLDARHWRHYLRWATPASHLHGELPHTPDQPDALTATNDWQAEESKFLQGRHYNQQLWLRRRSRSFALRWALWFQLPVLAINAFNLAYGVWVARQLWVIGLTTSLTLMLFALRDLLDYKPLFARYVRRYGNLEDLRRAYLIAKGEMPASELSPYIVSNPFVGLGDRERLQLFVALTERILAAEYEYWYASAH
jgi:hypothetical protein